MEETDSCRGRPWELKESVRCVFCRGVACKRCGENAYLNAISPAIEKFHCNWITDEILAMQRPADELFASIDLLGQFKALQITAVLNLTEPGEHPFCGYGNKSSGFPYSPERLMAVGSESPVTFSLFFCLFSLVKHFNFAWRDMTAPSISLTQNIVRVGMAELLEGGKVRLFLSLSLYLYHFLHLSSSCRLGCSPLSRWLWPDRDSRCLPGDGEDRRLC
jgi:hypothetical protein